MRSNAVELEFRRPPLAGGRQVNRNNIAENRQQGSIACVVTVMTDDYYTYYGSLSRATVQRGGLKRKKMKRCYSAVAIRQRVKRDKQMVYKPFHNDTPAPAQQQQSGHMDAATAAAWNRGARPYE